jgi:hypothetical protein
MPEPQLDIFRHNHNDNVMEVNNIVGYGIIGLLPDSGQLFL